MTVHRLPSHDDSALAADRRAALFAAVDHAVERALGGFEGRSTVSVDELAEILVVSRGMAYQLIRERRVPSFRVGRAIRVPVPALVALLLGVESTELSPARPPPAA